MRYGLKRKDGKWANRDGIIYPSIPNKPIFITTDINEACRYCDYCLLQWPSIEYKVEEYEEKSQ